jgi:hypothetical protein
MDSLNNMKKANEIHQELMELNAQLLSKCSKDTLFTIPDDYWELLDESVLTGVSDSADYTIDIPKIHPFSVPEQYFEDMPNAIFNQIEVESVESKLRQLEKSTYAVPQHYFTQLENNITSSLRSKNTTSVVQSEIKPRISIFKLGRIAAAIAIFICTGLAVTLMNSNKSAIDTAQLSFESLSKEEIQRYIQNNLDDFDTDLILNSIAYEKIGDDGLQELSREEVESYLLNAGW